MLFESLLILNIVAELIFVWTILKKQATYPSGITILLNWGYITELQVSLYDTSNSPAPLHSYPLVISPVDLTKWI